MTYEIFNPPALGPAKGWNNGMLAPPGGRVLFIAGQTARGTDGRVPETEVVDQFAAALDNVLSVLRAAGGTPADIGRMTVYVTDIQAYRDSLGPLGKVWRPRMGRHYPAMALVGVTELVDPNAMVEVEATAVLPQPISMHDGAPRQA